MEITIRELIIIFYVYPPPAYYIIGNHRTARLILVHQATFKIFSLNLKFRQDSRMHQSKIGEFKKSISQFQARSENLKK